MYVTTKKELIEKLLEISPGMRVKSHLLKRWKKEELEDAIKVFSKVREKTENDTQQELNKIVRNRDEKGNILTYSVFTKLPNGMICEFEKNNRKELKCFEVADDTTTKSELLKCDCGNTITDYEEICMDCEGMSWDERNTCEEELK